MKITSDKQLAKFLEPVVLSMADATRDKIANQLRNHMDNFDDMSKYSVDVEIRVEAKCNGFV